jgi:hypothetical protein
MTDDITHNLTVVRDALEAEGLTVHIGLIDSAIDDVAALRAQLADSNERAHLAEGTAELAMKHRNEAEAQLASARKALEEIRRATIEGRVCDDVAWFDPITTLHDFCDEVLFSLSDDKGQS